MNQNCSDVLIHIDEEISDDYIHGLEREISCKDGVYSACVHENARYLMLVEFDPDDIRANELLNTVKNHGLHAELVGL
ncbi:acyl-ACP--UDP-N- acetylglucosamine O-acyltransferase [Solemya velum gill symbiont]|uniref:acyl-ACP--UDP-N- acetylglucosamine O-acyltransferase n=1 Tax=Solemya velum gill symbiont TaxID=2340 RepID=UPI0009985055|nr:acyl-ACP--UDP-N- acetylglucosamine O-acyltransferase [Solemya velum gill symbiont]OOY47373.1 acyl-ACP--UDP-N- acetylglucosamine O-acyltransferase [Solemya velum gill symbiont]